MDQNVILSHIKTLRFEYLKKYLKKNSHGCGFSTLIPQDHISSNVEKISQIVGINISERINKNFSKSNITEKAKLFLALNSCPSFHEKLYWKAIYGPKERMAMLTSNIIKIAKGDFKEVALQIFAKVSSVLGFQHLSKNKTKNILEIKGKRQKIDQKYILNNKRL